MSCWFSVFKPTPPYSFSFHWFLLLNNFFVRGGSVLLVLQLVPAKHWLSFAPCLWNLRYAQRHLSCSLWRLIVDLLDKHALYLQRSSRDGIRALILLPTRELAAQTARECKKLARGKKFYIKLMTKQLVKTADFSKLHCDILISTPYRVQFAIRKKKLDLSR